MSIIAVDLGGTTVKLGRVDNGVIVARDSFPSQSARGVNGILDQLAASIQNLKTADCTGVAMGVPTLVNVRAQKIMSPMSDKFADLSDQVLGKWCREKLGLPLTIENDAHAALLGEWKQGQGRGCDELVMLTFGTGIGSSVILSGRPLRGRTGQAGNLCGHWVIDANGPECGCGGRGCVEAMQHLRVVRELARCDPRQHTTRLTGDFSYHDLFQMADAGDKLALELRDRSIAIWGGLIISTIHAFDPQRVIVGGGIARAGDFLLDRLGAIAASAWTPHHKVQVVPGLLGDDAALLGLYVLCTAELEYL